MTDLDKINLVLEAAEARRADRRAFLRQAGSVAAVAGATSLLAACGSDDNNSPTPTPTPTATPTPTPTATSSSAFSEGDVLNFALNLEYLEAQFYYAAAFGTPLPDTSTGPGTASTTTRGTVTGGSRVTFATETIAQYAREIAADEKAHVDFLRTAIGTTAVAQPNINISGAAGGPFDTLAQLAQVTTGPGQFNPYADENSFLLGAYIFEDVGVTAYKGAATSLTTRTVIEAAAGILAAEAYHAGLVRTILYARGLNADNLFTATDRISALRDSVDGASQLDQGIRGTSTQSNIVPTDSNSIAFSRSPGQVLNIVYGTRNSVSGGLFFPNGLNGTIRTSAAS